MTSLFEIPASIASSWHIITLIGLGLGVGVATGLFGVGGAFLVTPMLNIRLNAGGEDRSVSLLARLPGKPRITVRTAGLTNISLPGLCALGLLIGVLQGLLGIGGGVFIMPAMLLIVGLTVYQSIGTSLSIVFFSSIAGAIIYGRSGQASLWIVMLLLLGSSIGASGIFSSYRSWNGTRTGQLRIFPVGRASLSLNSYSG